MNHTASILKVCFWTTIVAALAVVVLFETDILLPGAWVSDKTCEYFAAVGVELYTLVALPLALRLFRFGAVRHRLVAGQEKALLPWGMFRLLLLGGMMVVSTVLYYMFLNVSFGYIAIILLIGMVFVYPSLERCVTETSAPKNEGKA